MTLKLHTFETGSQREEKTGKGRFDLISPRFLRRLALVLEKGAKLYGDRNWEKGLPLHSFLDSCLRHLAQFLMGQRDEDHLAHAAWNIHGLIHTLELIDSGELPLSLDTLGVSEVSDPIIQEPEQEPASHLAGMIAATMHKPLYLTDHFLDLLQDGPQTIQRTFDVLRSCGFTEDEILEAKDDLVKAGKVGYYNGNCYRLL